MTRTYDESLLEAIAVNNRDFARTYTRFLLRDMPEVESGGVPLGPGQPSRPRVATWPELSRTDLQLNMALELDRILDTTVSPPVSYYRPHVTAARLYLGDPALWRSRAVDGSSESRRSSTEITGAWLAQGAGLDRMIPAYLYPLPPFDEDGDVGGVDSEWQSPGIPLSVGGL